MRRAQMVCLVVTLALAGPFQQPAHAALPRDGKNCYIFVHGKQTDTRSSYNWSVARAYWQSPNTNIDFISAVTAYGPDPRSFYVVNYDGTAAWWDTKAGGTVAWQIVNATNGGADNGGNRCAYSYAQGGRFIVIAHSMGATIMDAILGNAYPGTPNYNYAGYPLSTVGQRISYVISLAGAHRGSQLADAVYGGNACGFLAGFIANPDPATWWLKTTNDVNVMTYSSAPAKDIWLIGGYRGIGINSACLSGQNDGAVQYASQFACNGSATDAYGNAAYPCGNSYKQKPSGFRNFDTAYEDHFGCKDCSQWGPRIAIIDGGWWCGSTRCTPGFIPFSSFATCWFLQQFADQMSWP